MLTIAFEDNGYTKRPNVIDVLDEDKRSIAVEAIILLLRFYRLKEK